MSRGIANMPGPGGSLGLCALCGDTFMAEILMGRRVQMVEVEGMDKDVCLHEKCMKVLEKNGPDWRTLPEGPLRRAYEKASTEQEQAEQDALKGQAEAGQAQEAQERCESEQDKGR